MPDIAALIDQAKERQHVRDDETTRRIAAQRASAEQQAKTLFASQLRDHFGLRMMEDLNIQLELERPDLVIACFTYQEISFSVAFLGHAVYLGTPERLGRYGYLGGLNTRNREPQVQQARYDQLLLAISRAVEPDQRG